MNVVIDAYAKINLTLDIFQKRADGFHSLASIMQAISLHDTLTFTLTEKPGVSFTCNLGESEGIPTDSNNLVVRAALLVLERLSQNHPVNNGVEIHLHKEIPSQAGLGGGSSDAAATIRGCETIFGIKISDKELINLAGQLGSDVPFFLVGGAAKVEGRGEKLTALPNIPMLWLVVVKPEAHVSTGWAYELLDEQKDRTSHRLTEKMAKAILNQDEELILLLQSNDFEHPILSHIPELAELQDDIRIAGALNSHLCGSGSAFYGIAQDKSSAELIAGRLRKKYQNVYVTHTIAKIDDSIL